MSAPAAPTAIACAAPGADQVLGAPVRERLRRWRPFAIALAVLLVVALLTTWSRPETSSTPLATTNPGDDGAQALTALLRDEGVTVTTVSSVDDAVAASSEGAAVALVNAGSLSAADRERLAGAGGDVVVIGSTYQALTGLTHLTSSGASASSSTPLEARCEDPDAVAAATLLGSRGSVATDGVRGAVGCFPVAVGTYAYATAPLPSGAVLRVIADSAALTNARLATAGNAALGVRALGHHDRVVWLDGDHMEPPSLWDTTSVPPWTPVVLAQLGLVVLALALVRGRRMGPVVVEDLPVAVRATETTRGRGRLYRRAGDRAHAARVLRAGTATRLGRRLGVPAGAATDELVAAVARATGRPEPLVHEVLACDPPTDDRALADLAVQLDRLESEAQRS
ncbi:hypothetical protein AXF14_01470 [Actinomyces radicidentis]|uniref:DUF4350 domain-containing protein n=1 Tax=Actinomyces radicidentis TaxID=111015 RepID=A0A109W226_ACTRD|nr:DUF4350 domain-containing protein [Actinomyces radicidentis]AMD86510.1 hypothetical protein AXF14_01470 [Actinomyces radicidentis]